MTADEVRAWMVSRRLTINGLAADMLVNPRTVDLWRANGTRYIVDVALNASYPEP